LLRGSERVGSVFLRAVSGVQSPGLVDWWLAGNRFAHVYIKSSIVSASVFRMNRATFCFWVLVLGAWTSGVAVGREAGPNILIIYADDLGWRDLSYCFDSEQKAKLLGSDYYETPHLDALAASGMTFTQAYSAAANCAPARASMLTGRYSPRHQIFNVGTALRGDPAHSRLVPVAGRAELGPGTITWGHCLQRRGYRTATIGKWHVSRDPVEFGFDVNVGGTDSGSPPRGYYPPHPRVPGLENARPEEYLTDRLTEEAIQFIEENRDEPWCLLLSHFAVHTPLQAKPALEMKYRDKGSGRMHTSAVMAAMIESLDQGVGRLLETLERLQLRENTVIVFSSDNGGYGPATSMHPLRGYKGTYFEGGIRVPLIVSWPKQIAAGVIQALPVSQIDFFPTLCELAGVSEEQLPAVDGRSLMPLLRGETPRETRSLFWYFPAYLESYPNRIDQQRDPLFRSRPCSVIRHGDWKLIQYLEDQEIRLYDLQHDMGESRDLSRKRPDVATALLHRLLAWQAETGATPPTQLNPRYSVELDIQAQVVAIRRQAEAATRPGTVVDDGVLPDAKRILFLGDSITYSGHYITLVETAIRLQHPQREVELLNLGLPSETVSGLSEPGHAGGQFPRPDLHERLTRVLDQVRPELVVACYGMNDGIYHPLSEDRFAAYRDGVERLRAAVLERGAELLLLTPAMFDARPIAERLLPAGEAAYPQPYVDYDSVLQHYAAWLLSKRTDHWQVLDVHGAMSRAVAEGRVVEPDFTFAADGVHPNEAGHAVIAKVLADHWGLELEDRAGDVEVVGRIALRNDVSGLVARRQERLKHAWLTETGHLRPGLPKGEERAKAEAAASEWLREIVGLVEGR